MHMTLETFKIEVIPLKHKLFRFAGSFLQRDADSEDVVQEVFIRLWARRDKLDQYRSIEAFALVITRNLCLDRIKSKAYNQDAWTEKNDVRSGHTPHLQTELKDSVGHVKKIMSTLPEKQRSIFHLRDVEGYGYSEIAELMGLSENTIRVNLSRARKKIRDVMIKKYNYEYTEN